MRKMLIVLSVMIFVVANVGLSQDIINETGKDGKFIVRDAEQNEALVIEDGNVGITGELSVESMPEGSISNPYVVWDPVDKKFKTVKRVFSKASPLSKPLHAETGQYGMRANASNGYVSASILDIQAIDVDDEIRIRNSSSTDGIAGTAHLSFRGSAGAEYGWMGDGGGSTNDLALFATTGNAKLIAWASGKGVELWDGTGQVVTVIGGEVGIGTTTPIAQLSIKADVAGAFQSGLHFDPLSGTEDWYMYMAADDDLIISNDGATVFTIEKNNGYVGIGTDNPVAELEVQRNNTATNSQLWIDNDGTGDATVGWTAGGTTYSIGIDNSDGNKFKIANSASVSGNTRLTINAAGDVGIGTTTPGYALDVNGTINAYGNSIFLRANTAEAAWYNGDYFSWGFGGNWNRFADAVSIGTQTTAPTEMLSVVDNAGSMGEIARFQSTNKGTNADGIIIRTGPDANPGSLNDFILFFDGNGTFIGSVDGDGGGGVRYNTTSDARLKMNIREYNNALEIVSRINVKEYEKISAPGRKEVGFLAQELIEIYPFAVSGTPDSDVNEEPMMIDYGRLTPLLLRAIQELQARIEVLEGR